MSKVANVALLVAVGAACSQMAVAQIPPPASPPLLDLNIANENSSLKWTLDAVGTSSPTGSASDPLQLPRALIWTVDGRPILVYPSSPWNTIDVGHFHTNGHVGADQLHAQGPLFGFAVPTPPTTPPSPPGIEGTITGGVVYTIDGDVAGSGRSRMVEKVDIHNKTGADQVFSLSGAGFEPAPHGGTGPQPLVPDYSGLEVTGTTTAFYQGNDIKYFISDFIPQGFPKSTVFPVVSFTGFNPTFANNFTLPAGAVLTIITELNVKPVDVTPPMGPPPDEEARPHRMRDWERAMDKDKRRREHSDHH